MESSFWSVVPSPEAAADTSFWVKHPRLPGVKCNTCGSTWAFANRVALDVDASVLAVLKKNRGPVSVADFVKQRDIVARSGDGETLVEMLEPGVELGRATVEKFDGPRSGRAYWFAYQLFVPGESLSKTGAKSSRSFDLVPCLPPFDWLLEIIPRTLSRHRIYSKPLCQKCGRVDRSSLDEAAYRIQLGEMTQEFGLVRVPGATIATAVGRHEIERLALTGIAFEAVEFRQLLELAR